MKAFADDFEEKKQRKPERKDWVLLFAIINIGSIFEQWQDA